MHVWVEGKITEEQKVLAKSANLMRQRIQDRLRASFAFPNHGNPASIHHDAILERLNRDLALVEARLWAASAPPVRAILKSAFTITTVLITNPDTNTDYNGIVDVKGYARVVDEHLQTLTSIQSQTMLTNPEVSLAHAIANECRLAAEQGVPIDADRYRWWAEQATANSQSPPR